MGESMRQLVSTCFLAALVGGCGGQSSNRTPTELFVYSIAGTFKPGPLPKDLETFHDYPVLGKISITDENERKSIMSTVRDSFDGNDGKLTECFWPRHAVRAIDNGKITDYLICFECSRMEIYSGESKLDKSIKPTSLLPGLKERLIAAGLPVPAVTSLQDDLNLRLTDGGIPLAP
jgi:hypothetical protein